jgi:hypothetical protein
MFTFDLNAWRGVVRVTVLPGESITFTARAVVHTVWDGTWELWLLDEEMPGAVSWFRALEPPAKRELARLIGTGQKAAADYIQGLGGDIGWLCGIDAEPAIQQVQEDFTFALRVGDLASSARTRHIGRITSITARTVKLLVAEWPGRQEKHRRYRIGDFAFRNCCLDPALLQIGQC